MEGLKESVNLRVTSVSFAWLTRHVIVPPIIKKKKRLQGKSGFKEEDGEFISL